MSFFRVGRNDPCPCGSGKKFKKCCLWRDRGSTLDHGPCEGPGVGGQPCGQASCGVLQCKLCLKTYRHCHGHHEILGIMMQGHVLRLHTEVVPEAKLRELFADELHMSEIYKRAEREPDLWSHFFRHLVKLGLVREVELKEEAS